MWPGGYPGRTVFGEIVEESTQLTPSRKAAQSHKVKSRGRFAALARFAPSRETAISVRTIRAESDICDHINLHQRIAWDTGCGDGGSHWRFSAEASLKNLIHARVVLQVGQVNVAFEDLIHRGAGFLKLLLDLVKDSLGMHFDITSLMVADAGDEDQVAVSDHAVEQWCLSVLGVVDKYFFGRFLSRDGWDRRGRYGSRRNSNP
jgi:hypothetical protein